MQDPSKLWRSGMRLRQKVKELFNQHLNDLEPVDARHRDVLKRKARQEAADKLRDQLAGGSLLAVGFARYDTCQEPKLIDARFWVGAEIRFHDNTAWKQGRAFTDVKVVQTGGQSQNAMDAVPPKTDDLTITSPGKPEKLPSNAEIRMKVIERCFDQKRVDFDDHGPADRYRIYLECVENIYPMVDTKRKGFSWKSFENDETKFKRNRGLITPKK